MINLKMAKTYCCENISLIENYQHAIADMTRTWVCHHRLECVNGIYTSPAELREKGLYWKRPAKELIFLTHADHRKIHNNDPIAKQKLSEFHKGKKLSEETKQKLSELKKGSLFWNNGSICIRSKECPGPKFVRGRLKLCK